MHKLILFVCTGNICRSPMAQGILESRVEGDNISVSSAGTHAYDGIPASGYADEVAEEAGIDISEHKSRLLDDGILESADIILVMEPGHVEFIERYFPEHADKTYLLREFSRQREDISTSEIEDPIGCGKKIYRECFLSLLEEIDRILPGLLKEN